MPYVFPHEQSFILGIGVLILGLVAFRLWLVRRRRSSSVAPEPPPDADDATPARRRN